MGGGRNVGLTIDGLRFIDVSTGKFSYDRRFNEIQAPWISHPRYGRGRDSRGDGEQP